jgi:hypothetical protein
MGLIFGFLESRQCSLPTQLVAERTQFSALIRSFSATVTRAKSALFARDTFCNGLLRNYDFGPFSGSPSLGPYAQWAKQRWPFLASA